MASESKRAEGAIDHSSDLRAITRHRLLVDMIEAAGAASVTDTGYSVLVVDEPSARVISTVCSMYDITDKGIALLEQLEKSRAPMRDFDVVYLVDPTPESMQLLIDDFPSAEKAKYAGVHLFTIMPIGPDAMEMLKEADVLLDRLQTCTELNVAFLATESYAFHLDMRADLSRFFAPDAALSSMVEETAARLVTLCGTLNEYPFVRFCAGREGGVTDALASAFQEAMNDYIALNKSYWYHGMDDSRPNERATLLLLDRGNDPLAPLLHEFTYQAMVHDLCELDGDEFTYEAQTGEGPKTRQVLLNENDPWWVKYRHDHIAAVADDLSGFLETFSREHRAAAALARGKDVDKRDLAAAMRGLPEYQEVLARYGLHNKLAGLCLDAYSSEKLDTASLLEQTLATGVDEEGSVPKSTALHHSLDTALSDGSMSTENKLRLLAIYIITQEGIKEADRRSLIRAAGLSPSQQDCILNLQHLGVTMQKSATSGRKKRKADKERIRRARAAADSAKYAASRYVPLVKELVESHLDGSLDKEAYPYVIEPPSGGAARRTASSAGHSKKKRLWAGGGGGGASGGSGGRRSGGDAGALTGGRIIVFVAGGVTHSEMRSMYELMEKYRRPIFVGGTSVMQPQRYITALSKLA